LPLDRGQLLVGGREEWPDAVLARERSRRKLRNAKGGGKGGSSFIPEGRGGRAITKKTGGGARIERSGSKRGEKKKRKSGAPFTGKKGRSIRIQERGSIRSIL